MDIVNGRPGKKLTVWIGGNLTVGLRKIEVAISSHNRTFLLRSLFSNMPYM
jgi:hypothetical protein